MQRTLTFNVRGRVGDLHRGRAARRNARDRLRRADGPLRALAHIAEEHHHVARLAHAMIEDDRAHNHRVARGRGRRVEVDVRSRDDQVGLVWPLHVKRYSGCVVGFAAFGNEVVRVGCHTDAAAARLARCVIGDLDGCAAARADQRNHLLRADGHAAPIAGVGKLHHHIFRIRRASVEHHRADGHQIARDRAAVEGYVVRGQDQVGLAALAARQRRRGLVVALARLQNGVMGIDHHLNAPVCTARRDGIGHLGHAARAWANPRDHLRFADGRRAAIGHIQELHQHIPHRQAAVVAHSGIDGRCALCADLRRVKPDLRAAQDEIHHRWRGDFKGRHGTVVVFVALHDQVVGIKHDLQRALAKVAARVIDDLRGLRAARRDRTDHGTRADGRCRAAGRIHELNDDILGHCAPGVEDRSGHHNRLAWVGRCRAEADVGGQRGQVGQRLGSHAQHSHRFVVGFVGLFHNGMGIGHHADAPFARLVAGVIGHLRGGAAARRDFVNGLLGADWLRAAIGDIHELNQHILCRRRARVEDRDRQGDHLPFHRLRR